MKNLVIFSIEILFCVGISLIVNLLLKSQLFKILEEICGSSKRADFWMTFTQLIIFISPLLLVTYFTETAQDDVPNLLADFQRTLFRSLFGEFIALMSIGFVIWRTIPSFEQKKSQEIQKV